MKAPTPYRRMRRAAEAALMRALVRLLRCMTVDQASDIGGAIGRFLGPRLGITRRAEKNIRASFMDINDRAIAAILREMWDNLGRTICEYAHLDHFRFYENGSRVEVRGLEYIDQVISLGKGAIFVSGHFANWELLPAGLVQRGLPVMTVYRAASNPLADEIITALRRTMGAPHQAPKGPAGARMLIAWMRDRKYVAMLADQKRNDGVEAMFFGRPAMCTPAA
ncbi:MAG: lauroyl acyltransferase, partial [Alphaproteobacteria bacterium]